jgi:hypothetical protein
MKDESNLRDQLTVVHEEVEELEAKLAPGHNLNHNETLLIAELESEFEELEEKVAPGVNLNHNETFIVDAC